MSSVLSNVDQINGTDASSEEGLMGITPGGVHNEASLVGPDGLSKGSGTLADDNLPPALLGWPGNVENLAGGVPEDGENNVSTELGLANLALDGAAVDSNISEVGKELLGTVLRVDEVEELGGVVNEGGPAVALDKGLVGEERAQEGDVGLDAADTELDEGTNHLAASNLVGGAVASALDQHGVVVRSDDGTGKAITSVETDTITTGRAVDLNLASIWPEALGGVLSGDYLISASLLYFLQVFLTSALNSKAPGRDPLLGQAQLLQARASRNLDLGSNNINSSNLLSDRVLDLDTGVDFDKVVAVLLVNQELGSTSVPVLDGARHADRIGENARADIGGEVLCGSNFDNLLVATLDGAVTLVQVDDVAKVVTEELDLNVLWPVEEALDKDGAVAESGLGPKIVSFVSEFGSGAHTRT